MKNSIFITFVIFVVLCCPPVSAQNGDVKTYKGEFDMVGFAWKYFGYWNGFGIITAVNGLATYHYRELDGGRQVFEGDFSFEKSPKNERDSQYEARGTFKNDRQIGKWIWKQHTYEDKSELYSECVFNFDDDGWLHGQFDMNFSHTWKGGRGFVNTYHETSKVTGVMENGVLVSVNFRDNDYLTVEGRYNKDGKPIGKWTLEGKLCENRKYIVTYDSNGRIADAYYINPRTGGRVNANINSITMYIDGFSLQPAHEMKKLIMTAIMAHLFRLTPK